MFLVFIRSHRVNEVCLGKLCVRVLFILAVTGHVFLTNSVSSDSLTEVAGTEGTFIYFLQGIEPAVETKQAGELAIGRLVGEGGAVLAGERAGGAAVALAAETPG